MTADTETYCLGRGYLLKLLDMIPLQMPRTRLAERCTGSQLKWVLLVAASMALLAASAYRACVFPFTHDESLSFAILTWDPKWALTANNHLLNTWLMGACLSIFGSTEASLRLPNLFAHAIYLLCSLAMLRHVRSVTLQIVGFTLLNLNLFVLDFFYLARGYGLGLACTLTSLLLLVEAASSPKHNGKTKAHIYSSAAFSYLAVLANFSFLYVFVPVLVAVSWWLLFRSDDPAKGSRLKNVLVLLVASIFAISWIVPKMWDLQRNGELYFGGKEGFVQDTAKSLVLGSLYTAPAPAWVVGTILYAMIGILGVCCLFCAWQMLGRPEGCFFTLSCFLLASTIALPILLHNVVGVLFPIERAAIYYIPLSMLVAISGADWVQARSTKKWVRSPIIAGFSLAGFLVTGHFLLHFDLHQSFTWSYNKHDKEAIEAVAQDARTRFSGQTIYLGNTWIFEPSLNYYRISRRYDWLAPVLRSPPGAFPYHYVYVTESELGEIWSEPYRVMREYPDTRTFLLRREVGQG